MICDLAQTYGIFDYKAVPVGLLATLAVGLPQNSRVVTALNGYKVPLDTLLAATAVDYLAMLVWFKTENGQKGENRPKSIYGSLVGLDSENTEEYELYSSAEEFEMAREKILRGD